MTTTPTPETTLREDIRKRLEGAMHELEQQRDELRVRLHLGKADARDEWERLHVKLDDLKLRMARGTDEAGDTAEKFETAMKGALEELRIGLQKAREHF